MRHVMMAMAVLGALLLAACGEKTSSERAVERAVNEALRKEGQKGKFTVSGDKMTFKDEETGEEVVATIPKGGTGGEAEGEVTVKGEKGKATWRLSKGKVAVKGEDGEEIEATAGSAAAVPKDFPKDVPLYPGAALIASHKQGKSFALHFQTADDPKKAAATCRKAFEAQGWTEEVAMDTPSGVVCSFKKGEREASLMVSKAGEDKTLVQITTKGEE